MNKELILYNIYNILMQKKEHPMTMDILSKNLKCSKKSLYKLFQSKNELLYEVFVLYIKQSKGVLNTIIELDCSGGQKLVFQIKALNHIAKLFFNSYLFQGLKSLHDFEAVLIKTERDFYSISFTHIVNELNIPENRKEKLMNILVFIGVSIKRRYTTTNHQEAVNDIQFSEMMVTLLQNYIQKEDIALHRVQNAV